MCDANIGSRLANALKRGGHDVTRSIHLLPQNAPDRDVLATAVTTDCILITCDSDFGELIFLKGHTAPPAVIYVQFEPQDVENIAPRILPILEMDNIIGKMIVIGEKADRMTAFPQ